MKRLSFCCPQSSPHHNAVSEEPAQKGLSLFQSFLVFSSLHQLSAKNKLLEVFTLLLVHDVILGVGVFWENNAQRWFTTGAKPIGFLAAGRKSSWRRQGGSALWEKEVLREGCTIFTLPTCFASSLSAAQSKGEARRCTKPSSTHNKDFNLDFTHPRVKENLNPWFPMFSAGRERPWKRCLTQWRGICLGVAWVGIKQEERTHYR